MQERESARAAYLDRRFADAEQWLKSGEGRTIEAAIDRIAKCQDRVSLGGRALSRRTLRTLFWRWQKHHSASKLVRNYKPGKVRIPEELGLEFLNRLTGGDIISAAAVMDSLRADWKRGVPIPGLGTWQEWARNHWGEKGWKRTMAPRFPVSTRSAYRFLDRGRPGEFCRLIRAALRGQRDVSRLLNHAGRCRDRLEAGLSHRPFAASADGSRHA